MAVTVDGERDILGLWAGDGGEGAKFWLHVLIEIKDRGADGGLQRCWKLSSRPPRVQIVCRDGSAAYAEAIRRALPDAIQVAAGGPCGTTSVRRS